MANAPDAEDLLIEPEDGLEEDDVPMSYDIATHPSDFTLAGISQMWKDGDISIPDFQREFVWSIRQVECPALFVPVKMRQTGTRGALYGTREEAYRSEE